jgi:hypothetical protein
VAWLELQGSEALNKFLKAADEYLVEHIGGA